MRYPNLSAAFAKSMEAAFGQRRTRRRESAVKLIGICAALTLCTDEVGTPQTRSYDDDKSLVDLQALEQSI
jgi:hypothetical protein